LEKKADILERKTRLAILHQDVALAFGLCIVEILEQRTGAIGGFIVHNDDFLVDRHRLHAQQHFLDERALVIDWNDDGNFHLDSEFSSMLRKSLVRVTAIAPAPDSESPTRKL